MEKIIIAKDLKEWLATIPDDAYVYKELILNGEAIRFCIENDQNKNYRQFSIWEMPEIIHIPRINNNPLDYLKSLIN